MAKNDDTTDTASQDDLEKAFKPSFQGHKAALGVGTKTAPNGVTTTTSFDPMSQTKQKKKFIEMPEESPSERMTITKSGQWSIEKGDFGMGDSGKVATSVAQAAPPPVKPKFKGSDLKVAGRGKVVGPGLTMAKNVNGSYSGEPNMVKTEKMVMAKNGQWSIEKATDENC